MGIDQEHYAEDVANRRPIAKIFRRLAQGAVVFCAKHEIHPDTISWFSIVPSFFAGLCFLGASSGPWLWVVGATLCVVRLWLNMLDGMVALATNKSTLRGKIVNEVPDRISDLVIFVGLAHFGGKIFLAGYWAAIMALLTAYIGIVGQTVGAPREFGGLMSKPWRMVVVIAMAIACFGSHFVQGIEANHACPRIIQSGCWTVVVGCVQTIVWRYTRTMHWLKQIDRTIP